MTEIGKATPGRAWRRWDVFGDDEAVAVMFTYGEAEHGILVQVDLAGIPVATAVGLSSNADRLIEAINGGSGREGEEFERSETISLADARAHIAGAIDRMDREPGAACPTAAWPSCRWSGAGSAGSRPKEPARSPSSPRPTARPRSMSS